MSGCFKSYVYHLCVPERPPGPPPTTTTLNFLSAVLERSDSVEIVAKDRFDNEKTRLYAVNMILVRKNITIGIVMNGRMKMVIFGFIQKLNPHLNLSIPFLLSGYPCSTVIKLKLIIHGMVKSNIDRL
jgi:hypothetical protein